MISDKLKKEIEEFISNDKHIRGKNKEEAYDEIISDIIETVKFYSSSPIDECIELLNKHHYDEKKMEKLGEYLTKEYHLFSKCPKLCYNTGDVVNYLKEIERHENVISHLYWIFDEINEIYEQPMWIYGAGGSDEIHLLSEDFFADMIEEAFEESKGIENVEEHFENMIRIIKEN